MNEKEINEIAEIANTIGNIKAAHVVREIELLDYTCPELVQAQKAMTEVASTVSHLHAKLYDLINELEVVRGERIFVLKARR